jgi:hypothetical protein
VTVDRLRQVAAGPREAHLFGNWFFSGNDGPLTASAPVFATRWLAGATGEEWLLEWSRIAQPRVWDVRSPCALGRLIDALLNIDNRPARLPQPPPSRFLPDQQVGLFRHGPITVALTGGTNAESHNHNDLGHFSVWTGDSLVVPDLGAPHYKSDFFGPKRYAYLSASSRGHCCPVINGVEQRPGSEAAGKVIALDLDRQVLSLDLTSAYPPDAKLARWTRSLSREGDAFVLADEFTTTAAGEVENVIWFTAKPTIDGNAIQASGTTLKLSPAAKVTVEAVNPADHLLRYINDTLYRVGVRYKTAANTPLRVSATISES